MQHEEKEFSFKNLFAPLTTLKAIHWIVIIGFIVYFNALFNGFVWDDVNYILKNTEVHNLNLIYFFQQNYFNNSGQYRALTEMYFAFLYSLFTTTPFFYHLIQLVIHIGNTIMVFFIFKKFFNSKLAFLLSIIFMVHPMQVESVSFISGAGSVLFFLFGIIALLFLSKKAIKIKEIIILFFLFLTSLLFKEAGVLFIFIGLVYVFAFNKANIMKFISILSAVLFSYFVIRFGIGQVYFQSRPLIPIDRLNLIQRLINIPQILIYYIKTMIFPLNLVIYQQWTVLSPNISNFWIPLIVIIVITVLLILFIVKYSLKHMEQKPIIFFITWSIVGFGLYSQISPLDMTVADRWIYFPLVGILGLVGCFLTYIPWIKKHNYYISGLLIFIILLFSIRTVIRNANWSDSVTLYAHDTKYQTNYLVENDYAQQLLLVGNFDQALIHQIKSVELFPYEQNLLNLADLYVKEGNIPLAEKYYILALNSKSYLPWKYKHIITTYIHYSKFLLQKGDSKKALIIAYNGLQDYNDSQLSTYLWTLFALSDYELGNRPDALKASEQAFNLMQNNSTNDLYIKLQNNEKINIKTYLISIP